MRPFDLEAPDPSAYDPEAGDSLAADGAPVDLASLTPADIADLEAQLAQMEAEEAKQRQAVLTTLGQRVLGEYRQRKGLRTEVEARWHADLRRMNGQYEPQQLQAMRSRGYGSTAFVPLTSRACSIVEARLSDMLFPADDRNFAITASPVPELAEAESLLAQTDPGQPLAGGLQAGSVALAVKELRHEAKSRAEAMQREVDDQLRESNYAAVGRSVIHDGIALGMGVMKGPVLMARVKKVWTAIDGQPTLRVIEDTAPSVCRVDPWNFYPDPTATSVEEATPIEVHHLSPRALRDLAQVPGFDADAVRSVLRNKPGVPTDNNREELREASGTQGADDRRYEVIEYHGPVEAEELRAMGVELPQAPDGEDDPLVMFDGIVFVATTGEVLKAAINPMSTEAHPYSVFNWRRDPGSIFGFGLSYDLTDLQELANSTYRAAIDNMGLSVGPQIVVGKGIRPMNGQWVIEPNKLWEQTEEGAPVNQSFAFFQIDTRMQELMGLFATTKQLIDEVSGSQLAMMGQDAPSFMETARGASMAYNAANIWMRRAVRLWDDGVTSPLVQRFVDFNMEHNPKAEIKGDLRVMARGTSALLEAESQAQKIAAFFELAKDVPMSLKNRVHQLREMAKGMRLDPVDLLPTDEEVAELQAQQEQQGPPPNPELERIRIREADLADRKEERDFQLAIERGRRELRVAEIASREQATVEATRMKYALDEGRLVSQLQDRQEQRAHDAQKFNAEMIVKQRMGSGI